MIIINPVMAESDVDDFLSVGKLSPYVKLMNSPFNTRLQLILPNHRNGQKLLAFDLDKGFHVGQVIKVEHQGVTILNVGIPITMSKDISKKISFGIDKHIQSKSVDVWWVSDAEGINEHKILLSAIKDSTANTLIKTWSETKSGIKSLLQEELVYA